MSRSYKWPQLLANTSASSHIVNLGVGNDKFVSDEI